VRAKRSADHPQTTRTARSAEPTGGPIGTLTYSTAGPDAGRVEVDFFWAVVHELRQPLTSITGKAQLAKRLLTSDPRRASEALDQVVAQIGRVDRVLTELHDRARSPSARGWAQRPPDV
jgi:K+-sensing histidine kinase KdpD